MLAALSIEFLGSTNVALVCFPTGLEAVFTPSPLLDIGARLFYWEFFTIRGGRGFAVGNTPANGVDLYSAGGKLCGHLDVHVFGDSWAVGRDGTLIVGLTADGNNSRWWPQLLQ